MELSPLCLLQGLKAQISSQLDPSGFHWALIQACLLVVKPFWIPHVAKVAYSEQSSSLVYCSRLSLFEQSQLRPLLIFRLVIALTLILRQVFAIEKCFLVFQMAFEIHQEQLLLLEGPILRLLYLWILELPEACSLFERQKGPNFSRFRMEQRLLLKVELSLCLISLLHHLSCLHFLA